MKIDMIGDVHGCYEELTELFYALDYQLQDHIFIHPRGRIPIFLGDLTDRGPDSIKTIELVYAMVIEHERAKYVPGNHCNKLYRYFLGNNVRINNGLETTVAELKALTHQKQEIIRSKFIELYERAPLYLHIPESNVVIAHAGIKQAYIGKINKKVKTFVLYGDITGEVDQYGRPIRLDWAQFYDGDTWIVYGHTPVIEPRKVNQTINIDTGCVFGNALTAFSLPEEKITSVPSQQPFIKHRFNNTFVV